MQLKIAIQHQAISSYKAGQAFDENYPSLYILAMWPYNGLAPMKSISVVEAKANFSGLLAEVEAGEEIAVTRHGKVIARMVPDHRRVAADAFRDFWADADEFDLVAPEDKPAEDVASLDD